MLIVCVASKWTRQQVVKLRVRQQQLLCHRRIRPRRDILFPLWDGNPRHFFRLIVGLIVVPAVVFLGISEVDTELGFTYTLDMRRIELVVPHAGGLSQTTIFFVSTSHH